MGSTSTNAAETARIVVTGGSGFIGRRVVRTFESAGHDVVAVVHPSDSSAPSEKRLPLDLSAGADLARVFVGVRYVVHLAARSGGLSVQARKPLDTFVHNIQVTTNVLRACQSVGVERLFLASSAVVYRPLGRPIKESDPTLSLADTPSGYAWSKICDEVQAGWTAKDLDVVIGRFTNVYGPGGGGRSTVIHDLVERALAVGRDGNLMVWGTGAAVRSFINVEDAARAIAVVTTQGEPGQAYNIDTGQDVAIADLAATIRELVNPRLKITFDPTKPAGDAYRVLDPTCLNELGFHPNISLELGLAELVASTKGPSHDDSSGAW